ncbi:hypothetical protein CHL78_001810 [Romboutsia weinsteinii]|uniref:Uncharacterized protein n=1 Tax=Romboutsia weinsteinii TaxID=2020949 RepID=A0A371J9L1_9FIRM|nr:hypothetical protein [Romboutsia weinsteinii]RDY29462.1 hypothetical protein CHL78_001810 [Romboutsia weinsteinii]
MSLAICFPITFAIMIINATLGVSVGIGYYLTMASLSTVCLVIGLVLFNSKKIFASKNKVVNKNNSKPATKQNKPKSVGHRRKIS